MSTSASCSLRPHTAAGPSSVRRVGRASVPVRASLPTSSKAPARRDDDAPSAFAPLKGLASGLLAAAMAFGIAADFSPAVAFPQVCRFGPLIYPMVKLGEGGRRCHIHAFFFSAGLQTRRWRDGGEAMRPGDARGGGGSPRSALNIC